VAETPSRRDFDLSEGFLDLAPDTLEALVPRVFRADGRVDREAGRHRDAEGGHLGEARALAAQALLAEARALGLAVPEEEHTFHFSFSTTISEKSANLE